MGTHRLIYIRTDAGRKIALGHLMRCIAVAGACRELGMEVCFLLSDSESEEALLHAASFPYVVLKSGSCQQPEQELPELLSLLRETHSISGNLYSPADSALLLDSYFVTKAYMDALRQTIKLAYIDDLRRFDYPADLIINYDVIPSHLMETYQAAYPSATARLLGASYAPLRRDFSNCDMHVNSELVNILVTTGGSDPCHFCVGLLSRLAKACSHHPELKNLHWQLVIGSMNSDGELLKKLAGELSALGINITLWENVTDMATRMKASDLALSAAGTTLYELCALGIPTISFILADNQETSALAFDETGAIPCAGDLRKDADSVYKAVFDFISGMGPIHVRQAAGQKMRLVTDGNGAERIARALNRKEW